MPLPERLCAGVIARRTDATLHTATLGANVFTVPVPAPHWHPCGDGRSSSGQSSGLLLLPIMVGLWILAAGVAAPVRLVLLLTVAGWNVFLFLPHRRMMRPLAHP